jgi:hypothetical protein
VPVYIQLKSSDTSVAQHWKSYVDVKWSISNGLVLPSGGAALTWGRCVNNRDLAKLGVVL